MTFEDGASPYQDDRPENRVSEPAAPRKARTTHKRTRAIILEKVKEKIEKGLSTIGFPYMDLETAVSVAKAMHSAGAVSLTREQLAGVMGNQVTGGGFLSKTATARTFGLISFSQGRFALTDLGFRIVDQDDRRQRLARTEAFLAVPLYRRVYEDFRGKQLPPRPNGLEQAFLRYGVAPKQTTNARLAFDKSAKQAGFFSAGVDRLIEPIIAGGSAPLIDERSNQNEEEELVENRVLRKNHSRAMPSEHHPFIQGLISTLPEPDTNWTVEGRAKWLQAAANIFDLIYKGDGRITVLQEKEKDLKD